MTLRNAVLAATLLVAPFAASAAEPISGLYMAGGAGANLLKDQTVALSNGLGGSLHSPNAGPALVFSMGYGFGNGLRAEFEGSYRSNSFSGNGSGGREQKLGIMANALYDINIVPWATPYIGGGIGYQIVALKGANFTNGATTSLASDDSRGAFAFQGIGGVAFPIDAVPGLAVTAEYRYLGLTGERSYGSTTTTGTVSAPNFKVTTEHNHSVLIGVRYAFNAPAAPMAPAATPAPAAMSARSYLVFFDWDKSNLTERARGIIKDAAANSAKVAYTKIDVSGYADNTGTATYNQGLSMRRAQAVAAELVKDGVPKAAIAINAFGETKPLVPTGPNVREPQNRRVEIIIR